MLYVQKTQYAPGKWKWHIGQIALATASEGASLDPGLFSFSIKGVHRNGEIFSTHQRAEALLRKHLGCDMTVVEEAIDQAIAIEREDRWIKRQPGDPPVHEQDDYTYYIGNVLLITLSNIKSIKRNGYHLSLLSPGATPVITVLSVTEGEHRLIEALGGSVVTIRRRKISYCLGPNYLPGSADDFACQPTLYDGSPAL